MVNFFKRVLASLSTGYILMFFSEFVFWSRYDPSGMTISSVILTWAAYSVLAFVFLTLLYEFRVKDIWGLFLAGAAFGWLAEGVLAHTAFENFPVNLSWTSLAWHALLSVLLGWYFIRMTVLRGDPAKVALLSGLTGLAWGFWAIFWWVEYGEARPFSEFAAYALLTTLFLIVNYWVLNKLQPFAFRPSKFELWTLGTLLGASFIFTLVVLQVDGLAFASLLGLLALVYAALRKNRAEEDHSDHHSFISSLGGNAELPLYALILLMPLAASIFYGLSLMVDLKLRTNVVVFFATTALGAVMFVMSLLKVFLGKK